MIYYSNWNILRVKWNGRNNYVRIMGIIQNCPEHTDVSSPYPYNDLRGGHPDCTMPRVEAVPFSEV
jgi:hypothetical protein